MYQYSEEHKLSRLWADDCLASLPGLNESLGTRPATAGDGVWYAKGLYVVYVMPLELITDYGIVNTSGIVDVEHHFKVSNSQVLV